jgi:hypothetical protein
VNKCFKNVEATSEFQSPEGWHKAEPTNLFSCADVLRVLRQCASIFTASEARCWGDETKKAALRYYSCGDHEMGGACCTCVSAHRVVVRKSEGKKNRLKDRRRWRDNIKMALTEIWRVWIEFGHIRLRIRMFHKMRGMSWVAKGLFASQGLCSMQLAQLVRFK